MLTRNIIDRKTFLLVGYETMNGCCNAKFLMVLTYFREYSFLPAFF